MTDRFPLIVNPDTKKIEELSSGDNLNLQDSGIVGATTINADNFVGNLQGNATSSNILNDAANISAGTISSSRLSGTYNINATSANTLNNAANITTGTINPSRLSGSYPIDITGVAAYADYLSSANNILTGTISAARLSGTYQINVSTASTASDLTPGLYNINISGNAATATTATSLSGGNITGVNLNISGISTLSGITTTGGNLYVGGNFYAPNSSYVGYSTITTADINSATVKKLTSTNLYVTGISTVGFLTATNIVSPNSTIGVLTATTLSNVSTASISNLTVDYLNLLEISSLDRINTGIASVGFSTIANAYIGVATISQLNLIGSTTVTGSFIGNLTGTATTATNLADAANITTGTISSSRLSGTYPISITGTATTATNLSNAANITAGTISSSRLSGSYNINITGSAALATTSTNVIGGIASVSQLSVTGFTTLGVVTASSYYGNGVNIVGIVTQITIGTGLTLTSSQLLGKGTVQVGIKTSIGKTIYVSYEGSDSNTGLVESDAKRTIKAAAALALPGDTIKVFPGTFVENNPITLDKDVSLHGTELRNCIVIPQNSNKDLFYVNNGCHITNLSFSGPPAVGNAAVVSLKPLSGVATDRFFDAARMIRMNLDYIAKEAVGYLTSTSYIGAGRTQISDPVFVVPTGNSNDCADDVKNIFLAICHDITRGGNSKCVGAGKSYYTQGGALQHIVGVDTNGYSVKQATIDTIKFAVGIANSCINNVSWTGNYQNQFTQVKDLSIQADSSTGSNRDINSCANVLSAVNTCAGIVTTIIGSGLSVLGVGINTTYPGNSGIGTTNPNDPSYSSGVGIITKGPYIRNCTNFIQNSIGLKIDGFNAEPGDQIDNGIQGSMSVDSYTQYNQGGIGVSITNGGYAQLVSIFTICNDIAIYTASGGQCDITNSNNSFGTYGLYSNGVGDQTSKSIFRNTGTTYTQALAEQDKIVVSGLGTYRPYSGQVVYFDKLYYLVESIEVTNGGSGYTSEPIVTIDSPTGPNGIRAEAFAVVENGTVVSVNIISTGNQYLTTPSVTITGGGGSNATASATLKPIYYRVTSATLPSSGISTVTLTENLNNTVSSGTTAYFSRMSLQVASTISFEYIGAGNTIETAKPSKGGVTNSDNEVVKKNGGEVVYTSTDQSGNFRIGDGVVINQLTGTISGRAFSQSLLNTVTPLIISLGK